MGTIRCLQVNTYILGVKELYRGEELEKQLLTQGISFSNFWGRDGRFFSKSEIETYVNRKKSKFILGRTLNVGEVCCRLGHQEIYCDFLQSEMPWALILEDDSVILDHQLAMILQDLRETEVPSVIQLSGISNSRGVPVYAVENDLSGFPFSKNRDIQLFATLTIPETTNAYLINHAAAKKISELDSKGGWYYPADWPLEWSSKVCFFYTLRSYIADAGNSSLIDSLSQRNSPENRRPRNHKLYTLRKCIEAVYNLTGLHSALAICHGISFKVHYSYVNRATFLSILKRLGAHQ